MGPLATDVSRQQPSPAPEVDESIRALQRGKVRLAALPLRERISLAEQCLDGVFENAHEWVEQACGAKGIPAGGPARAEEIAAGPTATSRYLVLLVRTLTDIERNGRPDLAGRVFKRSNGRIKVRVLPEPKLFDSVALSGLEAYVWLDESKASESAWTFPPPATCLVLGAGNVSSIAPTDAFSKIFQENRSVLLKMNPVNDYLGPIFERAFAALVRADLLRIVYGGAEVGAAAIKDERIDEVHITGSAASHDAIVWGSSAQERAQRIGAGDPRLKKPITSELGNVSPWIVVPGNYSRRQLDFQAENIAASIANNASFNCVATKMIVTWDRWPQREEFLDRIDGVLKRVPLRKAYYPGADERFHRVTGRQSKAGDGTLPWTLLRGADPDDAAHLFCEESFVCVCAETSLDASSEDDFFQKAVEFANERLWGTLAATMTVPDHYRTGAGRPMLDARLDQLQYGSVGVNHWPALLFAMMTPPWGGAPGSTPRDVQSGQGWVHNTLFLSGIEKTVLEGPLVLSPKPLWFPTHPNPEPVAWKVLDLYRKPNAWNLARLLGRAILASLGR